MFTSCCPGWVRFVKQHYPQFTAQLSSAKSPHQMMGAVVKKHARRRGRRGWQAAVCRVRYALRGEEVRVRRAGAFHGGRRDPGLARSDAGLVPDAPVAPELAAEAAPDDAVLTVREFGRLLRLVGVDCTALSEAPFDNPLGLSTGAATIFGRTGGVMGGGPTLGSLPHHRREPRFQRLRYHGRHAGDALDVPRACHWRRHGAHRCGQRPGEYVEAAGRVGIREAASTS